MKRTPLSSGTTLMVSALFLFSASFATAKETNYPLGTNATIRYYGWIHFADQSVDDGQERSSNIVDVSNVPSRFGFFIEPTNGGRLSFQFESSLGFRPSIKTSQTNIPDAWNWSRKDLRKVQFIYRTDFGTLRLGQGSMTTEGAAEADLGGTVIVAKSTIPESHGAYQFRTSGGALSGISIAQTFDNFDGPCCRLRLRFDTKSLAGFSFAAAYGQEVLTSGDNNDYLDFTLRYEKSFGSYDIKGAAGIEYVNNTAFGRQASIASISVLHRPTGLNLSIASGHAGSGGRESYGYYKAGWTSEFLKAGATKIVIEFFNGGDYGIRHGRSIMWGGPSFRNTSVKIWKSMPDIGRSLMKIRRRLPIKILGRFRLVPFGNSDLPQIRRALTVPNARPRLFCCRSQTL